MHAFNALASLALLFSARLAHASVYVTNPVQSTICTGGQSCQVQWIDNGEAPLLSNIGECEVGLYTGELELAQSLPSVNVATTSSFTFTPNPAAGPNGQYYIVFTASSINYMGFSGSFSLDGMTGTAPSGSGGAGGSSTPGSTSAGSSTPVGSSTPGTATPTGTSPSSPTGTSTPPVGTTTPTGSTPSATPGTTSPTISTPPASSPTPTTPTTSAKPSTTVSGSISGSSTSATPTATNAAVRVGSSASLGSALFLALAGAFVF